MMTPTQRRTLAVAMERILPSDAGPGATTANALVYVERMMHSDRFQARRPLLESGLGWLDSMAEAIGGKAFAECSDAERDLVLRHLQQTPHASCQLFFAMLVRMTLAGFLCPPAYGGNDSAVGWRYIGYVPRSAADDHVD
jgi:Gluconate 2-dehydrogenase subunit 3